MTILPTIITIMGPLRDIPTRIEADTLIDDLGFDMLDRQTIAIELDVAYGIEIPDAAIEKWQDVSDIEATVRNLTGVPA